MVHGAFGEEAAAGGHLGVAAGGLHVELAPLRTRKMVQRRRHLRLLTLRHINIQFIAFKMPAAIFLGGDFEQGLTFDVFILFAFQ